MLRLLLPLLLSAATAPALASPQEQRPLATRVDEAVQRGVRRLMETQVLEVQLEFVVQIQLPEITIHFTSSMV